MKLGEVKAVLERAGAFKLAVIAAAATLIALLAAATTPVRLLDGAAADLRVAFFAPKAGDDVVIIAIDEASVAQMRAEAIAAKACPCRAPISEAYLAGLIAALDERGARGIGVDLLLDDWPDLKARAVLKSTLAKTRAGVVLLKQSGEGLAAAGLNARLADGSLGQIDDFDAVLRWHRPFAETASLPAALAEIGGAAPGKAPVQIRWRAPGAGAASPFPIYPAAALAALPPEWIAGKLVLVGRLETDGGQPGLVEDQHLTPMRLRARYASGMTGVEGHAHVLSQALAGDRIHTPGPLAAGAMAFAMALGGAALGAGRGGWRLGFLGIAGGLLALALALIGAYAAWQWLAPVAAPALALGFGYLIANRVLAAALEKERAFLTRAFSQYLAPDVVAALVRRPQDLRLAAEKRAISVISTDVAGFSTMTASLAPELLRELMNAYFEGMISVFWRHGAMVDKLMGDGMLAIFGAPGDMPDHAARAIACAEELDAFAERFRADAPSRFSTAFGVTRIGVETGDALVGNFGGRLRFDYTAFGEVVVRAARLQAANKTLGGRILIGAGAAAASGSALTPAGEVALAGLSGAALVFRPSSGGG